MKSKKYTIKKHENEINLFFNIRELFVELLKPKNNTELKLYESYSNMFIDIIFLNCRYNEENEKFIKNFLDKFKNKLKKKISFNLNYNSILV